jgi:uncharacterized UBP type Zn finger protein
MGCPHLAEQRPADAPEPMSEDTCVGCVAEGRADWVHLRMCLTCGYVGCCDSSPRKHSSLHFGDTEHPVMRSMEPGESWRWCYVDEVVG